ncbi:MAG: TetR/AcrR family transcriptional regulator, partial [Gemmatimonadaceae bacterium]
LETLETFVRVFAEVWQTDRSVIRRMQGLATLDAEFARVWHRREERRRDGLRAIVTRVAAGRRGRSRLTDQSLATDVLYALIAFETFDVIAGADHRFEEIAPIINQLARNALGIAGGSAVRL